MQPDLFPLPRRRPQKHCWAITVDGRPAGVYVSTTKAGALAAFRRVLARTPDSWVQPGYRAEVVQLPREELKS